MSVNVHTEEGLQKVAGSGKIPQYTQEEYEAIKDQIPEGTMFAIKDDYEDGKKDRYSTQEIPVGTWIDGKTIYRIVVETVAESEDASLIVDVDVDKMIELRGVVHNTNNWETPISSYQSENAFRYITFNKATKVLYRRFNGSIGMPISIIMDYTKP